MKAILTLGVPCSGKTTWSEEHCRKTGAVNANRDDIRFAITGHRSWTTYRFKGETENMVTDVQKQIIMAAANAGKDVVVSDTNLNKRIRDEMTRFLTQLGYEVSIQVFHVSLEDAYKRDASRPNGVGRDVIYSMYQKYLEYTQRRTYTPDTALPEAVIVDVDGTVADMTGIRSPFEWDKVGHDLPRLEIIDMVHGLRSRGKKIVFLSGRDGICEPATRAWLQKHVGHFDDFFIRTAGDPRKDTIIKEELFWAHLADRYNITTAIDDRPCVVRLWHELGIKNVVAVANPYLEF